MTCLFNSYALRAYYKQSPGRGERSAPNGLRAHRHLGSGQSESPEETPVCHCSGPALALQMMLSCAHAFPLRRNSCSET